MANIKTSEFEDATLDCRQKESNPQVSNDQKSWLVGLLIGDFYTYFISQLKYAII